MTRSTHRMLGGAMAVAAIVTLAACTSPALAQCSTCATPTVAYSPVTYAAAPLTYAAPAPVATTVAYQPYTGWYPGRLFDRMRMRRWGVTDVAAPVYTTAYAPTYTAAYAPTYTAAYAPTYTAAYAPTYTVAYAPTAYTAAYAPAPYVTAYAPLQRPVVQTSYYAPTTVYSPAVLSPVVETPIMTAAPVSACGTPDCSACAGTTTVVEQASYAQPAAPPCSSCAGAATVIDYGSVAPAAAGIPSVGPDTGVPQLPTTPEPPARTYGTDRPVGENGADDSKTPVAPGPAADEIEPQADPNASFDAPRLLDPNGVQAGDRTANRPTVDVHNAVYRQPARTAAVNTTTARPIAKTQAEIDMEGWVSVPRN